MCCVNFKIISIYYLFNQKNKNAISSLGKSQIWTRFFKNLQYPLNPREILGEHPVEYFKSDSFPSPSSKYQSACFSPAWVSSGLFLSIIHCSSSNWVITSGLWSWCPIHGKKCISEVYTGNKKKFLLELISKHF